MHKRDFLNSRILVVDDEQDKLRLLFGLLSARGYTNIRLEADSSQAICHFQEWRPDLIILDFKMAPLNGLQVLEQIDPHVGSDDFLPVLMLTGEVSREVKEQALSAGAMDFLNKPFNSTELALRVRNLLHTRLLHLELQAEREALEVRVALRTAEVVRARNEVLQRLALAAEYRDDATGAHAQRVAQTVHDVAIQMGFQPAKAELVSKAALLHDLGKVGIPDVILLKTGKLLDHEFEEMKWHCPIGANILKGSESDLLQCAEIIARYHHEKWDGSGYEGLVGDEIPLEARITAVADVYDALTNERPYKKAWSLEESVAEIVRSAGSHFDPQVVDAFLAVVGRSQSSSDQSAAA